MIKLKHKGFTLIELLVVIAIIGVLSTIAVVAVNSARVKAKIAKSQGDLKQIRTAIQMLETDTGKWPNGCPPNQVTNPEVLLDTQQAGINQLPQVADQGDGCEWTANDLTVWNGPYMYATSIKDAWGRSYIFDPDYKPYEYCGTIDEETETAAILSAGPGINNANGINDYDCDDIFVKFLP